MKDRAIVAIISAEPVGRTRAPSFAKALEVAQQVWREDALSERTIDTYTKCVRRLEREVGGLTEPDQGALGARLKAWRDREQKRFMAQEISASHVSCDRSALLAFFGALVRKRRATGNPAKGLASVPVQHGLPRPIPVADQEKMLRLVDTSELPGLRDRAVLECLRHGMRQGEVANLALDGVSYDEREKAMFLEFRAKGRNRKRRRRDVPLEPTGATIVAEYLLLWFQEELYVGHDFRKQSYERTMASLQKLLKRLRGRTDRVFLTDTGRPIYQRWVNRMFNGYRDAAGVDKKFTVHTFRHRFCTALLDADVDIRDGMRVSGHEDPRSLMWYTHVARSRAVRSVGAIGAAPTRGD